MPDDKTRRLRKRLLALGIALALLVGVALAVPFALRALVVREARGRGLELEAGSMSFGLGTAELHDVRCSLLDVHGLEATASLVKLELSGLSPTRAAAEQGVIALTGASFVEDLTAWAGKYPDALAFPITASASGVTWRLSAQDAATVALHDGALATDAGTGSLRGGALAYQGKALGQVDLSWVLSAAGLTLGVGGDDPATAPFQLAAKTGGPAPSIAVTLAPTPLGPLGEAVGVPLPRVTADLHATVTLPRSAGKDGKDLADGTLQVTLHGFVPPHPRELDGLLFGGKTSLSARFTVAEGAKELKLQDVKVAAGALKLAGAGNVTPAGNGARIRAQLDGTVPCAQLVSSATEADLGKLLGPLAREVARRALSGVVNVGVTYDGLTDDLAAARVDKRAVLHCSL